MALTQDQIKHIAQLSRLELSPDQIEFYRRDLEAIVEYMDILKNVPESDLARVALSELLILPLRPDATVLSPISRESLLAVSEQKKIAGALALPNIMGA
jgi:aspartyl/glutamyl-tRNA(Asn/Gln) amidotransferase C subunit